MPPHSESQFNPRDVRALDARGISAAEAERQLEFFSRPPSPRHLIRPCTPGDGVLIVEEDWQASFRENFKHAAAAGRVGKFVPASGAASRMFKSVPEQTDKLEESLDRFPFAEKLKEAAGPNGPARALLSPEGLNYGALPKGLIPFHAYPSGARTPFEEHLVEAALYTADQDGLCRLHFTVSPEHEDGFRELFKSACPALEKEHGVTFHVSFSHQFPSTDTLAGDPEGGPFRTESGELVFRPGGHGALLKNLGELGGDIVVVKNIDNVLPDRLKGSTVLWKQVLIGLAVELQQKSHEMILALSQATPDPTLVESALALVERLRGVAPESPEPEALIRELDRPLRVCGMVRNEGEPGGGPFWVRDPRGISKQIVESAEVDLDSGEQRSIWESSTHFNPVDLITALRDPWGRPYDLTRFSDPQAAFVTEKSHEGRPLLALERPGLWNGAMALWNTVFVEVPLETFAPVKTVFDLLRPEHQPGPNPS